MLEVLFQDDHLLVLGKPAGLPVSPGGWQDGAPNLVAALQESFGRVWVVHRLDRTTSGVIAFARTAEAHRALNEQFERHTVEKVYHAIVEGLPRWEVHTARHMLRVNVGRRHRTVVVHERGKPSETCFTVLRRGTAQALLEARPRTGRTHQVRAHLQALGYPILGDILYGAPETASIDRPALHALSLSFQHPASGQQVSFHAPVPEDFIAALKRSGVYR